MKKKMKIAVGGFFIGIINGLLGAGGGMLAVPLLRNSGSDTQKSHAGAVAVILPISVLSAVLYLAGGKVKIGDALPYVPAGLVGAVLGGLLLVKIPQTVLRILFAGFMIWAGIRMMMG